MIKKLFLAALLMGITTHATSETISRNILNISNGPDFCEKLSAVLDTLDSITLMAITLPTCSTYRNGFWNDDVAIKVNYIPLPCTDSGAYQLRKMTYPGIEYTSYIREIIQDLGLRFISQTGEDSRLRDANGGDYILSFGIPHCE